MEASDRALKNAAAERAPSFVGAYISLLAINVLEQPRQTFEEIATLAQSIADRKLLFPPIVAQLERDQAQEYIEMVNGIWDTNHGIADLSPAINKDGQEVFFILLDGERRYRACMYLVNVGCEDHGAPCYDKHFDDGDVEVRLAIGINADDASDVQASANIHNRVPPHQEANYFSRKYNYQKRREPSLTVEKFARCVSKSADTIRTALKYCMLPPEIQNYVSKGIVSYGIAVEISRLKLELGYSDERLVRYMEIAIAGQYTVPDFAKYIKNTIREATSGQTMLGIFTDAQLAEVEQQGVKQMFERSSIENIWKAIQYLDRLSLIVNQDNSPFSMASPRRVMQTFVDRIEGLEPHWDDLLSAKKREKAQLVLSTAKQLLTELDGVDASQNPADGNGPTTIFKATSTN